MSELLGSLNTAQREAVVHTEGPVLVLAGPGSGKTRVLTYRVAYLIQEGGVPPWRIMAVTFTNKAANEMKERLQALLGDADLSNLTIGTFHAICVRILRREADVLGIDRNFVIYDDSDQRSLVRQTIRELNLDDKLYRPRAMQNLISRAKTEMLGPKDFEPRNYREEVARRIYVRYQQLLLENNAFDFDDLLLRVVVALREQPELLQKYQRRYQYVLVDEFQDTNAVQYELVRQLSGGYHNLFAVGDEDQCVVAGTTIETKEGPQAVEALQPGTRIVCASGHSDAAHGKIDACPSRHYRGPVVVVTTVGGRKVVATPEHCVFGRFDPESGYHYVYIMYSQALGYRIGRTGSRRTSGAKVYTGFAERLRQERGDAIWLLRACADSGEAAYWEALYAAQYGLPTACFYAGGRRLAMDDEQIKRIYANLDTAAAAERLAQDLGIFLSQPHHMPQATIRGESVRKTISFTMFGSKQTKRGEGRRRVHVRDPWHVHELSICSSDPDYRRQVEAVLPTKPHKKHYWAARRAHGDYDQMDQTLSALAQAVPDARVWKRARLTEQRYDFMPIGHLLPGAMVPVLESDGTIGEDEVASVTIEQYDGRVYDLSVPIYRNYVAGGIVVHNSIYAFRGANFYNVLKFELDYPETRKVLLERNYRSTQTILDVANAAIAPNTQRTPKKLYTERDKGPLVWTHEAYDENQEGRWVVQTIQDLIREGASPGECAAMYRTNAQSRALEDAFLAEGMPYKLVGATRFYARREVKDLMAYMRIIHNPYDTVSLMRIVNVPPRLIGAKTLARLVDWATRCGIPLHDALHDLSQRDDVPIHASGRRALLGFYEMWAEWIALRDQVSVLELLDKVIEGTGYGAYLRDGSQEGEDRWENVLELRSVASEYSHLPLDEALLTFLEEISLVSDVDNLDDTEAPTLLTLHSAKGLEFETVFIVGLNDGLLPHSRCFDDPDAMEEERRLFYVGVTRAQNRLYLAHTFRRTIFGSSELGAPSRFLSDIPAQLKMSAAQPASQQSRMRFGRTRREASARQRPLRAAVKAPLRTGDAVRHPTFGEGMVIEVKQRGADWDVTVAFKGRGIKTLAASFANLEKVG